MVSPPSDCIRRSVLPLCRLRPDVSGPPPLTPWVSAVVRQTPLGERHRGMPCPAQWLWEVSALPWSLGGALPATTYTPTFTHLCAPLACPSCSSGSPSRVGRMPCPEKPCTARWFWGTGPRIMRNNATTYSLNFYFENGFSQSCLVGGSSRSRRALGRCHQ